MNAHSAPHRTVVIAPDSFKGSLAAAEVAAAMAAGVTAVFGDAVRVVQCPVADGGEGTLEAFVAAGVVTAQETSVHDAIGRRRTGRYGLSRDGAMAVIEAAQANGLPLVADVPLEPMQADSFGVGELAARALDDGVDEILLGIGGSASTDGGTGFMRALGVRFLDHAGRDVAPGGGGLPFIATVDESGLHPRARSVRWRIATDVDSPLRGPRGAAYVFGPQKGATAAQVRALDEGVAHLAAVLHATYGVDATDLPGAGAAGGLPVALHAMLNAQLTPGFDSVAKAMNLEELLSEASLVLTGEGCLDRQTLQGKVIHGVVNLTPPGCPVVAIAGTVKLNSAELRAAGISAAFSIARGPSQLIELINDSARLIEDVARNVAGLLPWRSPITPTGPKQCRSLG
jgi:glycerate 2-kinase